MTLAAQVDPAAKALAVRVISNLSNIPTYTRIDLVYCRFGHSDVVTCTPRIVGSVG